MHDATPDQCPVFGVVDDRHAEHLRALERPPHEFRVHHRVAVVGDCDDPGLVHAGKGGQLFPREPDRHGSHREHLGELSRVRAFEDEACHRRRVVHRARVRHAGDAGHPAGDRRPGPGRDRLLVLEAWLAKVDVHVDETRHDQQPGGIDALDRRRAPARQLFRDSCLDRGDDAIAHEHVSATRATGDRVDERPARDEERRLGAPGGGGGAFSHRWRPSSVRPRPARAGVPGSPRTPPRRTGGDRRARRARPCGPRHHW